MADDITNLLKQLQVSELNLQVSNEELQAAVEELSTMNEEFQALNDELSEKNKNLEKLSILARYTHELVLITNSEQRIEWVNNAFENLTGYTLPEVKGKKPNFLRGKDTNPDHSRKLREGIASQKPFQQEILNYGKNQNPYWLLISITPIFDSENKLTNFIAIELDITKQKEQEEQLIALNNHNNSLKQFSYIVSHNLRSNVANMLGLMELIGMEKHLSNELKDYVDMLNKSVNSLDNTIRDLNDILSIRSDIHKVYRKFEWKALFEDILIDLQPQIRESGAVICLNIETNNAYSVWSYCKSILHNFIGNAIKYSKPKQRPQIIVNVLQVEKMQKIEVIDKGLGIDLEKYGEQIFGLYRRFHEEVEGKGVGLYIAKTQTEMLGGSVEVQSEVGQGSCFTAFLPLQV
jgi:PAS domain S-box-containing protein